MLHWRASDPSDYEIPHGDNHRGLVAMPAHNRIGPPVLGTGFTPSGRHLVPEFVTRDFADLPLPANATVLAYPPEGVEMVLYTYQPEQRRWLRLAGPQWRHLPAAVPDLSADQEYVPIDDGSWSTRLVGTYQDRTCEAVADPPGEFPVLARTRAAGYPVETVCRRLRMTSWRGASGLALREEAGWVRLRLCRPGSGQRRGARRAVLRTRGVRDLGARRGTHRRPHRGPPVRPLNWPKPSAVKTAAPETATRRSRLLAGGRR